MEQLNEFAIVEHLLKFRIRIRHSAFSDYFTGQKEISCNRDTNSLQQL